MIEDDVRMQVEGFARVPVLAHEEVAEVAEAEDIDERVVLQRDEAETARRELRHVRARVEPAEVLERAGIIVVV